MKRTVKALLAAILSLSVMCGLIVPAALAEEQLFLTEQTFPVEDYLNASEESSFKQTEDDVFDHEEEEIPIISDVVPELSDDVDTEFNDIMPENEVPLSLPVIQEAAAVSGNRNNYTDKEHGGNLDHSYDNIIYQALRAGVTDLTDDKYGLKKDTYAKQIQYVIETHPDLIGILDYYRTYLLANDQTLAYTVKYIDNFAEERAAFDTRLPVFIAEYQALLPTNATQFEKVHVAHDFLVATTAYDKVGIDTGYFRYDYDSSGVVTHHYSCCMGYSAALKLLLSSVGVDCITAVSTNSLHEWNVVKIDGEWYHVDTSGDDPAYDMLGRVGHGFLCVSTEFLVSAEPEKDDFVLMPHDYNMIFTDELCATSRRYESGQFWNKANTSCHYYNGHLYTVGEDCCLYRDGEFYTYPIGEIMHWCPFGISSANFYEACCRISGYGNRIYMTSTTGIFEINLDNDTQKLIYRHEGETGQIFGLARIESQLYCTIDVNYPDGNETWIPVSGAEIDKPVIITPPSEPEVVPGLQIPGEDDVLTRVDVSDYMGKSISVNFIGLRDGEDLRLYSTDDDIISASFDGNTISISCLKNGTAQLSVSHMKGEELISNYSINVTVYPVYSETKTIELDYNGSTTVYDMSGDYADSYKALLLDTSVAAVTVSSMQEASTPGAVASASQWSGFSAGQYLIGSGGKYLTIINGKLTATSDINMATIWTISGTSSGATVSADGFYLVHSTSAVSLSTSSANGTWLYSSSNGFYFTQSVKSFWSTSTKTYRIILKNDSFTMSSTTTSGKVSGYVFLPEAPSTPGAIYTAIRFDAIGSGTTQVIVGKTLYTVNVAREPVYQTVTVNIVDDLYEPLAASYTITGIAGSSYSIIPQTISNYTTPDVINGVYTEEPTAIVTLVYVLNTDKTALLNELNNVIAKDNYTDDSYNAYINALNSGREAADNSRAKQAQVDTAYSAIVSAKAALKEIVTYKLLSLDGNGIDSGTEYAIVYNGYALAVVNGTLTTVKIENADGGIKSPGDNALWIISGSSSGYTIRNKETGNYLNYSSSGSIFKRSVSLVLSTSSVKWKSTNSGSNLKLYVTVSAVKYYLTGGSSFSVAKSGSNQTLSMYR